MRLSVDLNTSLGKEPPGIETIHNDKFILITILTFPPVNMSMHLEPK